MNETKQLADTIDNSEETTGFERMCASAIRGLLRENEAMAQELEAAKERWKQFEEYDCDELKATYALVDNLQTKCVALQAKLSIFEQRKQHEIP